MAKGEYGDKYVIRQSVIFREKSSVVDTFGCVGERNCFNNKMSGDCYIYIISIFTYWCIL